MTFYTLLLAAVRVVYASEKQCAADGGCAGVGHTLRPDLPTQRMAYPHAFFPFDMFGEGATPFISEEMRQEIQHVRPYCMFPPYPWSLVAYDFLVTGNILNPNSQIAGAFAEFGVGVGGTSIYFARKAKTFGRKFLSVDSFAGLPPPTKDDNSYFTEGDYGPPEGKDNYKAFLALAKRFDVNDTLTAVKGFFGDIEIPDDPAFEQFAFVHLDSDLYSSIYDSLVKVWDRVSPGGFVIIDDYFHFVQGPARAVSDFFRDHVGQPPVLYVLPVHSVLIIKGHTPCPEGVSSTVFDRENLKNVDFLTVDEEWGVDTGFTKPSVARALDGNFYSFVALRSIPALHQTVEASVARVRSEREARAARGESLREIDRVLMNAEDFSAFLKYPSEAGQSSVDIFRYLAPFEDMIDVQENYICNGKKPKNEIEIFADGVHEFTGSW